MLQFTFNPFRWLLYDASGKIGVILANLGRRMRQRRTLFRVTLWQFLTGSVSVVDLPKWKWFHYWKGLFYLNDPSGGENYQAIWHEQGAPPLTITTTTTGITTIFWSAFSECYRWNRHASSGNPSMSSATKSWSNYALLKSLFYHCIHNTAAPPAPHYLTHLPPP